MENRAGAMRSPSTAFVTVTTSGLKMQWTFEVFTKIIRFDAIRFLSLGFFDSKGVCQESARTIPELKVEIRHAIDKIAKMSSKIHQHEAAIYRILCSALHDLHVYILNY